MEPKPECLADYTHFQYGTGEHYSASRKIIGSVHIDAFADSGLKFSIRHLLLDGSSPWVVGKNVTRHSNILHLEKNA